MKLEINSIRLQVIIDGVLIEVERDKHNGVQSQGVLHVTTLEQRQQAEYAFCSLELFAQHFARRNRLVFCPRCEAVVATVHDSGDDLCSRCKLVL